MLKHVDNFFCKGEDYRVECLISKCSREKERVVLLLNVGQLARENEKNESMLACFVFKSEMY